MSEPVVWSVKGWVGKLPVLSLNVKTRPGTSEADGKEMTPGFEDVSMRANDVLAFTEAILQKSQLKAEGFHEQLERSCEGCIVEIEERGFEVEASCFAIVGKRKRGDVVEVW